MKDNTAVKFENLQVAKFVINHIFLYKQVFSLQNINQIKYSLYKISYPFLPDLFLKNFFCKHLEVFYVNLLFTSETTNGGTF